MRFLSAILLSLILLSCNKKEEVKPTEPIVVSGAGSTNFGKVRIGEYRLAGIQIKNNTSENVPYSVSGITSPFTIDGVSGDCSLVAVFANGTCTVKIRFTPLTSVESFMSATILGKTIPFRGKGLQPGTLALGLASWSAGTFRAGEQRTLNIPVTNIGDTNLGIPRVATPGFSIIAQNCGTEILPGENCQIVAAVQKALAQEYIELLQFYTLDSPTFYNMDFFADVRPGPPSGIIEFPVMLPTQLLGDGISTMSISTMPIRDDFGNVVSDGEVAIATARNLDMIGSTSTTTVNGIATFNVRSRTSIYEKTDLVITSGLASGTFNLTPLSGPPFGNIKIRSNTNSIRADGLSSITLETDPIKNKFNEYVTDGTPIEVTLVGPGTIVTTELQTVRGVLRVKIQSTTTADLNGRVYMRGEIPTNGDARAVSQYVMPNDPMDIRDHSPLAFLPLDEIGNFDIESDHSSIYFDQNGSGRIDQTNVRVVDIRDENDNPVGAGFTADIRITNGKHAISNLTSFSMSTDALSALTFPVKGMGLRDWITVDVTVNGKSKSHRIFAIGEQEIFHNRGVTNKITLKEQRADSRFNVNTMIPSDVSWKDVEVDYYGIRSQDNSNFGFRKSFGRWQEIVGPRRHLIWDCIIPIQSWVGTPPCEEKKKDGATDFMYRSYSIHETKTERTPETFVNANIPTLPSYAPAFGEHILGPVTSYDVIENKFHIFGGVAPVPVDVIVGMTTVERYQFDEVNSAITYGDVSLMAYAPFAFSSYDEDLAFPIAPSYYRYKDRIYIFGGVKKQIPGISAGDLVQLFKDGNLTNILVGPGADGSPVGRYQNGVYFEEDTQELFVFGGRNSNGDYLDEIWKVNLSVPVKSWEKVCNLCGLPDTTINNAAAIVSMLSIPVNMNVWQNTFEPMRPPVVIKDTKTKKTFLSAPYKSILAEVDFTNGDIDDEVLDEEYQEFKNYGHLVQHHTMDRFYRHDIITQASTDTRLFFKDGKKGEMVYYKAEVTVNEEARLFGSELVPTISAYSLNRTTRLATTIAEYGVQVYLFDFVANRWSLVGESNIDSPGYLTSAAYNVRPVVINPQKFFSPDNKVHILIKPKQEVGYQINATPEAGSSNLLINLIQLNGVF